MNSFTENEAKTKFCPMSFGMTAGGQQQQGPCRASECMAWIWIREDEWRVRTGPDRWMPARAVQQRESPDAYLEPGVGYCGLTQISRTNT
jgi:hypothetical protein